MKEYTPGEQPQDQQYIKLNTNEQNLNISEENLNAVLEGMRSVAVDPGGTAYNVFKDFEIEIGGKTVIVDKTGNKTIVSPQNQPIE